MRKSLLFALVIVVMSVTASAEVLIAHRAVTTKTEIAFEGKTYLVGGDGFEPTMMFEAPLELAQFMASYPVPETSFATDCTKPPCKLIVTGGTQWDPGAIVIDTGLVQRQVKSGNRPEPAEHDPDIRWELNPRFPFSERATLPYAGMKTLALRFPTGEKAPVYIVTATVTTQPQPGSLNGCHRGNDFVAWLAVGTFAPFSEPREFRVALAGNEIEPIATAVFTRTDVDHRSWYSALWSAETQERILALAVENAARTGGEPSVTLLFTNPEGLSFTQVLRGGALAGNGCTL